MPRPLRTWLFAGGAGLVFAACSFDWDAYEPPPVSATTSAAGGTGGASDGGGGAPGGNGGLGGQPGGMGGQPLPTLVDRGLLARYFLDEADSGMAPSKVADSAPDPLELSLDYGEIADPNPPVGGMGGTGGSGGFGGSGPNLSWVERQDQRGLMFQVKNRSGGASASIAAVTKLQGLDGVTEATIECVADPDDAGGAGVCTRLFHFGQNNNGELTLCVEPQSLSFRFNGRKIETWDVDYTALGRIVVHAVLDTSLAEDDRVLLYVDGRSQGVGQLHNTPPAELEPLAITGGRIVLGNRNDEDASTEGVLYYCALYSVALTAAEVAENTTLLLGNDDSP